MRNNRGFTLVELAVVLFVLGLVLWVALPRLSNIGEPDRDTVFRVLSADSEAAYDLSLFEKRETRLVLLPSAGTYEFRRPDRPDDEKRPRAFGARLTVTGIRIEGEDRPLDLPTEIRYLPGGRVASARIFFRDEGGGGTPSQWTLRLSPFDGSFKILEGTVREDG
ncbi:MAG: prepilin-type N-terminal cleavage/methylation domain-containing protein [bacterium]|jgi:prepilin-type N-terminal cleavage/methylation domain-containing protein